MSHRWIEKKDIKNKKINNYYLFFPSLLQQFELTKVENANIYNGCIRNLRREFSINKPETSNFIYSNRYSFPYLHKGRVKIYSKHEHATKMNS